MYLQIGNTRILQESMSPEYTKEVTQQGASGDAEQSQKKPQRLEKGHTEKPLDTPKERQDALDFAVNSTKKAEYSLVGADSDLASLDIAKAISDMQKDSILQEYQYFVRSGM